MWCRFCTTHNLHHLLADVEDPVPILSVFMRRYRDGHLAIQGQPVRGRSVEDVVRQIVKAFFELGSSDPRLNAFGRLDLRLSGLQRHWRQIDPEPARVKPIPLSVIHLACRTTYAGTNAGDSCLDNMIYIAFFFLCQPGEYTAASAHARPFRFQDVQLWLGHRRLSLDHDGEDLLLRATCSVLIFTNQKNCVPGEVVAIGTLGSSLACATHAIARWVAYLRSKGAPANTPLSTFHNGRVCCCLSDAMVMAVLSTAADVLGPSVGLTSREISARLLRSSGAMAMLYSGMDPCITRLRGRWRSDAMLRYLTVQSAQLVADVASSIQARSGTGCPGHCHCP